MLIDVSSAQHAHTTVGPDATAGAARVVDHLLTVHGHDSVALVIGESADPVSDGRERGWIDAHARAGRRLGTVERTSFSRQGGHAAGIRLLGGSDRPSAVFVSSDAQAVGVLHAAHELGLSVPDDLALGGFDDSEESRFCWPPLTTARQPAREMAEAAVAAVLRGGATPEHLVFEMPLVIRRSCGCPGT